MTSPAEATELHTRILRLALAIPESRDYWANVDPAVPAAKRGTPAFEQRWFGAKSADRVRTLLAYLAARYDAWPHSLEVLRRWRSMDPATRQLICHWHLQLSDPLYRRFTGEFLVARRAQGLDTVDRDVVLRWLDQVEPGRWARATQVQFASKLLAAASEAGLVVGPRTGARKLASPHVTDDALVYFVRVFEPITIAGGRFDNPYLASVGLEGGLLEHRLRTLPGLDFRRMGELYELHWAVSDEAWREGLR